MVRTRKQPQKILVVEDDPDILNALNIALSSVGFDVDVLLSGKSILQNRFVVPDLFILDKQLPDIDGLEICRYLKSQPNYRNVPVIIISTSPRIRRKALQSGATSFIKKPFVMQDLVTMIRQTLRLPATT